MKAGNLLLALIFGVISTNPSWAEGPAGSMPLESAYEMALKSHPRIKMAERQIVKSSLLPDKANSQYFPHVNGYGYFIEANKTITYGPTDAELEPEEQAKANFELVQPLFKAAYFPLKELALREMDRSSELYAVAAQDIFFEVAQSYYQILEAKELIANAQEYLELARADLRFSKVKFDAGEVTEDAVIQSELNVVRAEGSLIESRNMLRIARDVFKSTVGIEGGDFDVVQPEPLHMPEGDLDTLFKTALGNRSDYRVALYDIEQAKTDITVTKAGFFPTLQGDVNYYLVDQDAFDQANDYLEATVKLVVPFYDGGARYTEIKEKRETLSQAMLSRKDLENSIRIGVEESLVKIDSAKTMLDNLRKQQELTKKNYEITKNKFDFGAATILELDQALAAMNNVKTNLITKTYDYQMGLLRLQKAMGLFVKDKCVYSPPEES